MTFAPLFSSPCDLAVRIPPMISDFLNLENKIGRRFREDSVTDIIIASLLKVAGRNVTVLVPPEVKTGGDFDILIVEPSSGDAIQYRIQAKRLSPHPTQWMWGSYRELDHPHGQGGQSSTLVRSAAHEKIRTIPLYAFYNPETACKASGGLIGGIELADGVAINQIVKALVKAKAASKRPRLKRLENLRDLFFPLSTLLCPPAGEASASIPAIVPPGLSRASVEDAIRSRARMDGAGRDRVAQLRPPPRGRSAITARADLDQGSVQSPRAVTPYPAPIERAILRTSDEDPVRIAPVKRPKVVLISREGQG